MMTKYPRGAEWRRWDLHIHNPMSGLNNQFPRLTSGEPDWEAYIERLESLRGICALGITDYFTIEGYRKILEFRQQGRLKSIPLIMPNIEFRLDKVINTSSGPRRLNYHVIFSDKVTPDEIDEHFLQELKFCFEGDPQRADLSWSVRRPNLEMLGRKLKSEHKAFDDHRADFEIGCMNATVDPSKIKAVLENKQRVFGRKYLIVLPEEHLSLLDWNGQDHQTRKTLLQGADAVFSATEKTIRWTRGEGDLDPEQFCAEFKSLKPCLHGSDGHHLDMLGMPDNKRFCWIKAEPTFEGLKQVLYEPRERVFIGEEPPQLKNDYQVIESIRVEASDWFNATEIPLNADLVAIIGPRGSGKSALAEMIAFAGGADLFRLGDDLEDTFLSKASQRSLANPNPITGAALTLTWRDGTIDSLSIPPNLRHGRQEERVKYLPQKFVELLCAPENNRQLEEEIERVVFQRISKTARMEASNFKELRQASTGALQVKRNRLARTIKALNQSISETWVRISLKRTKENELKRKSAELASLLKNMPQVPQENKEEVRQLEELTKERQQIEGTIARHAEQLTILDTIETKFEVLRHDLDSFNSEIDELLDKTELVADKPIFRVALPSEVPAILTGRRTVLEKTIEALLRIGTSHPSQLKALETVTKQIDEIRVKSKLTETKRKEYEKFQADRKRIEDSIASLEREIKEIEEVLLPRKKQEDDARLEHYLGTFDLLKEEKEILESLYEPLRGALLSSNETAKKLTFISKTAFDVRRHASRGMELLDRRKSTYRDQEDLEAALTSFYRELEDAEFDHDKMRTALIAFRDSFFKQGENKLTIEDQLRKDRRPKEFADWFYGIDDFSVAYSITFDNKDLRFLSPGEKGIVLLLLYLEAENEDNRPLIIDQPDDNLDNISVYPSLIDYFRSRKRTRQIIIITHNPNLVVNTNAEQVFVAEFDGTRTPKVSYRSGGLEDTNRNDPVTGIREEVCKILEGGTEAFQLREKRYALS